MRIESGSLTGWELEFHVSIDTIEMGLSMRLTAPNGETYYITCRDGQTIDVQRVPAPVVTQTPNERATTAAPRTFEYVTSNAATFLPDEHSPLTYERFTSMVENIEADRLRYREATPRYVGIMHPDVASAVLRALDEGLFPEGEEGETSCL